MSYRGVGQIPSNGGYLPGGGDRNGIFGQVPTNGGYRIGVAARKAIFGYGQIPAGAVYLSPPYYNDAGLRRIDQQSLPAFKWSVNTTTTSDADAGSVMQQVPGFTETYTMEVGSGVGDYWLDTYLSSGFVVLYWGKSAGQLTTTLSFAMSKDPMYIAANAASAADYAMVIDGPESIISQAKQILSGTAPSGGGFPTVPSTASTCPPGTVGIPPACVPTSTTPPTTPPTTNGGGCPPGTVGIPPFCVPTTVPGGTTPPVTPPVIPPVTPPVTEPPVTPPVTKPPPAPVVAKTETPTWVLPALLGVAGVSLFVILAASRKKA